MLAAFFIAIVPSYMSRSVAGSYDNEGVAIFALVFTFYLYIRAQRLGTILSGSLAALSYFFMVASWGGHSFIIMFLPTYTLAMLIAGRFTLNMYIAYSSFYALGHLMTPLVHFIGPSLIFNH